MNKIFKNRYGEIRCGWAIVSLILLLLISLFIAQVLLPEDSHSPGNRILVAIIYGVLTIGGGLLLIKLFYNCSFKQIGIIKDNWLFEMIHGILIGTVARSLS